MVLETAIKRNVEYLVPRDDDIKIGSNLTREKTKHDATVLSVSKFLTIFDK